MFKESFGSSAWHVARITRDTCKPLLGDITRPNSRRRATTAPFSFNGRGVQGSNRKVCHPGETVQFELDCEQGTLSLWVNNEPQVRRVIVPRGCRA